MTSHNFDVIIAGAGPSGCSAALCLASSGLSIALIDKATFPREKVCGDAISYDSLKQIAKISPSLANKIKTEANKVVAKSVLLSFPDGYNYSYPIANKHENCIIKRKLFDNLLLQECKNKKNIKVFENTTVKACTISNDEVVIKCTHKTFYGKMVLGADGINSVISKSVNKNRNNKLKYALAIRSYFKNVQEVNDNNLIEMHFLKKLNPGYLWIFDMHGGIKNVGFGIDESIVRKNKIDMKQTFKDLLYQNDNFAKRFQGSTMLEEAKAFRIPIYSAKKEIYFNRLLLIGDAAHLVNPWSGEGVGNAIRTGRFAAEQVLKCFAKNNFSKKFNYAYYKKIRRKMIPELKKQAFARKLNNYPQILKFALKLTVH